VYQLLGASDFILRPQPDLVFFRDQSVWIGDQVAVASPAGAGRRLPAELTGIVYAHHPLFAGTKSLYRPGLEPLHGGDLLLAAPGVIAAGCCPPAGVVRLARGVFDAGLAHTVLVVPSGHPDRRRAWTGCGWWKPASGPGPGAGSSGTTPATCWCWPRGWWSRMSATWPRTPGCSGSVSM
jgi:hypothetical protein